MILRHAKAVPWSPGIEDFPRPLSPVGTEHAIKLADWMCEHLELPDGILCSPSQRTRETLAPLLALRPELESITNFVPQVYGAPTSMLVTMLDHAFVQADRILIVGHNPGFEMLAFDVIGPSEYNKIRRLPTGTLVVVNFQSGWEVDAGRGLISHKIRGKKLSVN
jgi:phosphohistidine phosphatase SixA